MREAGGAGGVRDFLICGHGNGGDGDDNARNGNHLWRVMEDVSDICFLEACGDALIRCNSNDVVLGRALRADAPTRVYFAGIYST